MPEGARHPALGEPARHLAPSACAAPLDGGSERTREMAPPGETGQMGMACLYVYRT